MSRGTAHRPSRGLLHRLGVDDLSVLVERDDRGDLARCAVGSRAGITFCTGTSRGGRCFLTSNAEAPQPEFSVVACQAPGATATSSNTTPLVDLSALVTAMANGDEPKAPTRHSSISPYRMGRSPSARVRETRCREVIRLGSIVT